MVFRFRNRGQRYLNSSPIKTAFIWSAYISRSDGLKLIKRDKIHVDTLLTTNDGFEDLVHWQAILALCPKLIDESEIKKRKYNTSSQKNWRRCLRLPFCVNSILANKLVQCAYGEPIQLDRDNLAEFYHLAERYEIHYAIKICLNYARSLLDVSNCIQLLLLSLKHRNHSLRRSSYSILRSNFKSILFTNEDFHLLPYDYLEHLLLDDYLKLNEDEEFAWIAIVRWMSERTLNKLDMIELYNEMIAPVASSNHQASTADWMPNRFMSQGAKSILTRSSANIFSPARIITRPVPVVNYRSLPCFIETITPAKPLNLWTESDRINIGCDLKAKNLINLIKCLRFMRFRSLNAFKVIEENQFVQQDDKLSLLIINMKLRFVIRKRLCYDKKQLEQLITSKCLKKLRNSEIPISMRLFRRVKKLIDIGPIACDHLVQNPQNNPIEIPEVIDRKVPLQKLTEEQLDEVNQDCLMICERPRVPNSVALMIGGWHDGSVCKTLMAYDFVCDKWFKLNIKLPEPRAFHASCRSIRNNQIFIMGGTNGREILSSVLRFDPGLDVRTDKSSSSSKGDLIYKFHRVCSMKEKRCHLSGVFHTDGRLYALGGHNGQQRLRTGEWYDSRSDQWQSIADMTIARSDASACSHENKIFIAGGQIGDQFIQSSVEFYKPSDNTWTFASPMIVPRMSFQLISYRGLLLALGGTIGIIGGDDIASLTRSVEKYSSQLGSWSLCAPMNQKRSSFGAINIDNKLIVVGGHGGSKRLKTCEQLEIGQLEQIASDNITRTNSDPVLHGIRGNRITGNTEIQLETSGLNAASEARINQMLGFRVATIPSVRTTMKWIDKAKLPAKRTGFSLCVVNQIKNAKDFTYHGSKKSNQHKRDGDKVQETNRVSVIKQKSRWHRFKIMRRRKLVKNLKIALVVTIVILIM